MLTLDATDPMEVWHDTKAQHEAYHDHQVKRHGGLVALWYLLSTASMAASAYHGYKRNESIGWALGWGFLGALFPVITPTIAVAQGFGKRKR